MAVAPNRTHKILLSVMCSLIVNSIYADDQKQGQLKANSSKKYGHVIAVGIGAVAVLATLPFFKKTLVHKNDFISQDEGANTEVPLQKKDPVHAEAIGSNDQELGFQETLDQTCNKQSPLAINRAQSDQEVIATDSEIDTSIYMNKIPDLTVGEIPSFAREEVWSMLAVSAALDMFYLKSSIKIIEDVISNAEKKSNLCAQLKERAVSSWGSLSSKERDRVTDTINKQHAFVRMYYTYNILCMAELQQSLSPLVKTFVSKYKNTLDKHQLSGG